MSEGAPGGGAPHTGGPVCIDPTIECDNEEEKMRSLVGAESVILRASDVMGKVLKVVAKGCSGVGLAVKGLAPLGLTDSVTSCRVVSFLAGITLARSFLSCWESLRERASFSHTKAMHAACRSDFACIAISQATHGFPARCAHSPAMALCFPQSATDCGAKVVLISPFACGK